MSAFYQLSLDDQVKTLETMARKALESWNLADAELWKLKYRENCVFGVRDKTTGTQYALRIHRPGYHDAQALQSELLWMEALRHDGLHTPDVIHTTDGQLNITVQVDAVPEARVCDLLGWVEGEQLGQIEGGETNLSADQIRANHKLAGRIAAQVHNQAQNWAIPEGFKRPVMDGPGLVSEQGYLGDFRTHPHLTPEQLALLNRAADKLLADFEAFGKASHRFGLTHADFLPENMLLDNGDVRLIDFDDCGFGWYLMDLATTLFFLLGEEGFEPAMEGLIDGYRELRELPDEELEMLGAFFLARCLCYVAWVATRQETAEFEELSPLLIGAAVDLANDYLGQA